MYLGYSQSMSTVECIRNEDCNGGAIDFIIQACISLILSWALISTIKKDTTISDACIHFFYFHATYVDFLYVLRLKDLYCCGTVV